VKDFVASLLLSYLVLFCQFAAVLPPAAANESSPGELLPGVNVRKRSDGASATDGVTRWESRVIPLPKAEFTDKAGQLLRSGDGRGAENILSLLIRQEEENSGTEAPGLILLCRLMGDACLLQGKLSEAESNIRRAIMLQLAQKKGPTEDLAYDMALLGQILLKEGRISDAQTMFALGLGGIDQLYKGDAKPSELRIALIDLLARTLEQEGDWTKAEPLLERLLNLQTQHQQALKIADKDIADTRKRLEHIKSSQADRAGLQKPARESGDPPSTNP
jgi:tetratricopeptide (TPR) repeat protein